MHIQRNKLVIHVAKMQQILFFVHQLMMNVDFPIRNVSCGSVLYVVLLLPPGVEMDSSNQAPTIMFNTYMSQFTCSHHGILIREKITTYLDAKGKSKRTCFLCEELIKPKSTDFTRRQLHERVKLFSMQRNIGDFHKDFYIKKSTK